MYEKIDHADDIDHNKVDKQINVCWYNKKETRGHEDVHDVVVTKCQPSDVAKKLDRCAGST